MPDDGPKWRRGLAVAIAAVVTAAGATACDDSTSDAPGLAEVTWVPAGGEPRTFDVGQLTAGYPEATIASNMCESLLRLNPDGTVAPGLAELPQHPDPLTYIFKMRPGARFWDGAPVTAADAVASLKRSIAPTAANAFWLLGVESVSQRGDDEVAVKLSSPNVTLPDYLATAAGAVAQDAFMQTKGADYGTPSGGLMCSGPFMLDGWVRGSSLTLVRNPNYWDAERAARIDTLRFQFIEDPATLTSALLSGQVDGTFAAPSTGLGELSRSDAGSLTSGPALQVISLSVLASSGPMADARVREAFNVAVDRPAFAKTIAGGGAAPVRSSILPATWSYEKSQFQQAYDKLPGAAPDLARARALVQAAGTPDQPIVIATASDPTFQQVATYAVSVLESIGLNAEVKVYPSLSEFVTLFYDPAARKGLDLMVNLNYAGFAEPLALLASIALPTGLNNYNGYGDDRVTALVGQAMASQTDADRAKYIIEADAIFEQAPTSFMLAAPRTELWQSRRVTGAPADWTYLGSAWGAALRSTGS